jgi:GntR family transcriptional regulator
MLGVDPEQPPAAAELPEATIDRASPVPFYFQLAGILEEEIVTGRWEPGSRLPSEGELCNEYGLSRTTIRQALARLEQEGLISREKGRGTFVSSSRPRTWLIQSTEGFFHGEFLRAGRAVTSRIMRIERCALPRWACDALSLPVGARGLVLERLRSVDGLVALYVVNCLPDYVAEHVAGLEPNESLYQRLVERGGISIVGGSRSLEALIAGPRLAGLLEMDASAAVAYIESVMWDELDRPVDAYRAWLRTDRMRLDINVTTQRSDGEAAPGARTELQR